MKKILIVAIAVVALGVTSFALWQTDAHASQSTLTYITESLPDFPVGVSMQYQLEAVGGTPPYRFEIVQGTLPEGLHMNQHGKISGKSKEEADTTVFVRLTDAAGASLTQAFAVRSTTSTSQRARR